MLFWCHIRHLNPLKIHPRRTAKADKTWLMILFIKKLNFWPLRKILARLKRKTIFVLMYFVMKPSWLILFMYKMKNLKTVWIC